MTDEGTQDKKFVVTYPYSLTPLLGYARYKQKRNAQSQPRLQEDRAETENQIQSNILSRSPPSSVK